jgi:DNA-binding NtrC family response regulator
MSTQPPTVLILDDDTAVRESLMYYFEDREWRVLPAATAEDALDLLEREAPDGAVVDIRLPGMDGDAFIRKAIALRPQMCCVISTGSAAYHTPSDVAMHPNVADIVCHKPVQDLSTIENLLLHMIEQVNEKSDQDE